ncbi:MAG: HPr family phosphocarrier protein [Eubacteriales bacterium]|nr:HPr family phosphocarrier protein [Eubacteriales bacterium]
MVREKVTLNNFMGLHLRTANVLCNEATKFQSAVSVLYNDSYANAKSILSLLEVCVKCGSEIEIICEGPDELCALENVVAVINNGLGE